jgi:NADH-quinone oxidoreductase subunit N
MNLAAFAVVVARERETGLGDDMESLRGLGAERPLLAWPMTIAMLSLAGLPVTMGFFGKITLIEAAVDNDWAWLAVAIVIGSAISLAYYLRVIAAVWMRAPEDDLAPADAAAVPAGAGARPLIAGGSPEADEDPALRGEPAREILRDRPGAARSTLDQDDLDAPLPPVRRSQPEVVFVAVLCAAATVGFGVYPEPLLNVAEEAAGALGNLL